MRSLIFLTQFEHQLFPSSRKIIFQKTNQIKLRKTALSKKFNKNNNEIDDEK